MEILIVFFALVVLPAIVGVVVFALVSRHEKQKLERVDHWKKQLIEGRLKVSEAEQQLERLTKEKT